MDFFAHGIGGAKDLPIPAEYAIAGAGAALAVSFIVLALAWRTPKFKDSNQGRPAPPFITSIADSTWFPLLLRVFGMACFLYFGAAAVFGKDLEINPVFGFFYAILWVGIVVLSLLFGPVYRALSPVRTINLLVSRLAGSDPELGIRDYPTRWGLWPAAIGLYAYVWFELVYPYSVQLGPLRLWVAAYVGAMLIGGAIFGNRFYAYADPFEVYSTLVGRLSVLARDDTGKLVLRNPLANLDHTPMKPGLLAVVSVLLGSTAFDSFSNSTYWLSTTNNLTISIPLFGTLMLTVFVVVVAIVFALATMLTGIDSTTVPRRELPLQFAHTLVPIVVGYVLAHYMSFLVEYGQQTLIFASDPFSTGANYLGTADRAVNYIFSRNPTLLAVSKVAAVVIGHVLAVISSHDRAIRLLPKRHQLTGQLPLLVVMVAFTVGGLALLFGA